MTKDNQQTFLVESQKWMALALLLLTGWVLYLLAPILSPFIVGAVLAYLGDPLVDRLEKRKVPRTWGVIAVFVLFTGLSIIALVMFVPLIEEQIVILYKSIPDYIAWLNTTAIPWVELQTGMSIDIFEPGVILSKIQEHIQSAGSIAATILSGVGSSSMALALWLTNLALIPVVAFYLMRDWDNMVGNIKEMLPRKKVATITRLASEMDEVLGAFLRGQMLVMLALGIIYSIGLWAIGLNVALIIGMIAGLASIVPYLGFFVGIAAAITASILQIGELNHIIYVVMVFGFGQMLESMLLTPLLVGDKIGLHPVAVIFAIMAGGQLFGFVGILVALPVAAVIMVWLRHIHRQYKLSAVYSDEDTEQIVNKNSAADLNSETELESETKTKTKTKTESEQLDSNTDLPEAASAKADSPKATSPKAASSKAE